MFEPNTCEVTADRAKRLFTDICRYFERDSLESEKIDHKEKLLVTLNVQETGDTKDRMIAEFLLENTWNEFHYWSVNLARVENKLLKCYRVAMEILNCMKRASEDRFQYKIKTMSAIIDSHTVETIEDHIMKLRQGAGSKKMSRAATLIKPEDLIGKPIPDRIDGHTI